MTVVCSSEVLCLHSHWLCSADIAVGLLVWCLNDRLRVDLHKADSCLTAFRQNRHSIANCINIQRSVNWLRLFGRWTDRRTDSRMRSAGNIFLISKELDSDIEQRVAEYSAADCHS